MPAGRCDDERQAYPAAYAAEHGTFALIPAAYVFLVEGERVLLQLREGTGYYDGWWAASAAGHVDPGESVLAGAARETREEIGVEVAEYDLEPITAMHRTAPTGLPATSDSTRSSSPGPGAASPRCRRSWPARSSGSRSPRCQTGSCITSGSRSRAGATARFPPSRHSGSDVETVTDAGAERG